MRNGGPNTELANLKYFEFESPEHSLPMRHCLGRLASLTGPEALKEIVAQFRFAAKNRLKIEIPVYEGRPRTEVFRAIFSPRESAKAASILSKHFSIRVLPGRAIDLGFVFLDGRRS